AVETDQPAEERMRFWNCGPAGGGGLNRQAEIGGEAFNGFARAGENRAAAGDQQRLARGLDEIGGGGDRGGIGEGTKVSNRGFVRWDLPRAETDVDRQF